MVFSSSDSSDSESETSVSAALVKDDDDVNDSDRDSDGADDDDDDEEGEGDEEEGKSKAVDRFEFKLEYDSIEEYELARAEQQKEDSALMLAMDDGFPASNTIAKTVSQGIYVGKLIAPFTPLLFLCGGACERGKKCVRFKSLKPHLVGCFVCLKEGAEEDDGTKTWKKAWGAWFRIESPLQFDTSNYKKHFTAHHVGAILEAAAVKATPVTVEKLAKIEKKKEQLLMTR